jgi:hypothetical protein
MVMLAAAVEYLPRAADRAATAGAGQPPIRGRWYDKLGVVWMLSIPFAPVFSWILTNAIDVDAGNWRWLLGLRAIFCVAVPAICVLPLLRYVQRGTAGIALAILAIGTGFPVAAGIDSAYDLVRGPAWQEVTIKDIRDIDFTTGTGTQVHAGGVQVKLADGRTLSRSPKVPLRPGLADVLVLRGFGRIIGAR